MRMGRPGPGPGPDMGMGMRGPQSRDGPRDDGRGGRDMGRRQESPRDRDMGRGGPRDADMGMRMPRDGPPGGGMGMGGGGGQMGGPGAPPGVAPMMSGGPGGPGPMEMGMGSPNMMGGAPMRMEPMMQTPPQMVQPQPQPQSMAPQLPIAPNNLPLQSSSAVPMGGPKIITHPAPERTLEGMNVTSVFVTGLAWWTTDEDVRIMVMEVIGGHTPFNLIFDENKANGKSLGSVFIDVASDHIAMTVIKGLHGRRLHNKELKAELYGQSGEGQTMDMSAAGAQMAAPKSNANATPLGEKRKPLDEADREPAKKRIKTEPSGTEICKWHLEGGCRYEGNCKLLHPDISAPQKSSREGKESSRSERKSREEDREKDQKRSSHRSSRSTRDKEEKKSSRKDEDRKERHSKTSSSSTRHRHRHQDHSEESAGSDPDSKSRRRRT